MMLSRILKIIGHTEDAIACLALVLVLVSVIWGIASRLLPMDSAVWATELSGLAFTWVAFVGASAAYRRGIHVSVPVLTNRLPENVRRVVGLIVQVLLVVFLCYSLFLSVKLSLQSFNRLSPVLRIPFFYVYAAMIFGFFSMTLTATNQLVEDSLALVGESDDTDDRNRKQ